MSKRIAIGLFGTTVGLWAPMSGPPAASAQEWGDEIVLLESPGTPSYVGLSNGGIAVTPDRTIHVVWTEQDAELEGSLRHQVYTAEVVDDAVSTAAHLIVPYLDSYPGRPDTGAKWPTLTTDPAGDLHLAWHDYRIGEIWNVEIYYKHRPQGTEWDPSAAADLRLTTTDHAEWNGDNGYLPTIRRSPLGELRVVWFDMRFYPEEAEIMSKATLFGGGWDTTPGDSADERLTENPANSEFPDLVFDTEGTAHVAYADNTDDLYGIYHTWLPAGGAEWSGPQKITPDSVVARSPSLAASPDGSILCVWEDGREGAARVYAALLDSAGAPWSDAEPVSPIGVGVSGPAAASTPDGIFHVVWSDRRLGFFDDVVWYQHGKGGEWDPSGAMDERISTGTRATDPEITGSLDGRVVVSWRDKSEDSSADIWMRIRSVAPTGVADAPPAIPARSRFGTPRPNPFNPRVILPLELSVEGFVRVDVHSISGRRVRRLLARRLEPGTHHLLWDGRNDAGHPLPSGSYIARLGSTETEAHTMLILLK